MYEDITYEDILDRMLDRVPDTVDKREGSIIYDALAPAAVELQLMYIELDYVLNEVYADTASREYLVKRAAERGMTPKEATYAIVKGTFEPDTCDISIGASFSVDAVNYTVTEKIKAGEYYLQCDTSGTAGNIATGKLIPNDYISGLTSASITELITHGEDEEDTEVFRERYFDSFNAYSFGGNIADYKEKCLALTGVGAVKVVPPTSEGGTILIYLLGTDYGTIDSDKVDELQETIDPDSTRDGTGIAPIGHKVMVASAVSSPIYVKTTLTLEEGYTSDMITSDINEAVEEYFLTLRKEWAEQDHTVVRISKLESALLGVTGILDVNSTKTGVIKDGDISWKSGNREITNSEIPVLKEVITE